MAIKSKMPATYSQRAGFLSVYRGSFQDKYQLFSWDYVDPCVPDSCAMRDICTFGSSNKDGGGKCQVQSRYLRAFADMVFNNFASKLDESTMYRIGIHMVPMYKMLVKLKMIEVGLPDYVLGNGKNVKIHPVLKEIRETIRIIEGMWSAIGIKEEVVLPHDGIDDIGTNYYETMEKSAQDDRVVTGGKEKSGIGSLLKKG